MNKEIKQELYTSPEVEVLETNAQQMICASVGGTEKYQEGNWNN